MRSSKWIAGIFLAAAMTVPASSAQAEVLTFHAKLDGKYGAAPTGSAATGVARVDVDTKTRRVSMDLKVKGITADALWDKLVAAPIGPVHLHKYASPGAASSVLVVPFPYGPNYRPTKTGMNLTVAGYDYAAGAKLVNSDLTFDDFVAAMRSGLIVLNIHTDAFNPGEISGTLTDGRPVPAHQPSTHSGH